LSRRVGDDRRLLDLLQQAWLESGRVYGYRKLTQDMRDLGEHCGKHRVARLLRLAGIRSQTGYRSRPGGRGGKPAIEAPDHLQRQFTVDEPNRAWVTDITYNPHPRGLAVSGGGGGLVFSSRGGLVDGKPYR
jgi:putative transposase